MECGADEAERFKRHLGLAVLKNETLIENDMFCIACMAELKAHPPPSKEKPVIKGLRHIFLVIVLTIADAICPMSTCRRVAYAGSRSRTVTRARAPIPGALAVLIILLISVARVYICVRSLGPRQRTVRLGASYRNGGLVEKFPYVIDVNLPGAGRPLRVQLTKHP